MNKLLATIAVCLALGGLAALFGSWPASAQPGPESTRILASVDDNTVVAIPGNVRPEVTALSDRGRVADSFALDHLLLLLRRSPRQERELGHLIEELENPEAPNYHHWLTAQQFGVRFGPSQHDINAIKAWLHSHRFEVNYVYPSGTLIEFSGDAGAVREAFHTEIHSLLVNGKPHFANVNDPQVPVALEPVIAGVVSLNDFRPRPMYRRRSA